MPAETLLLELFQRFIVLLLGLGAQFLVALFHQQFGVVELLQTLQLGLVALLLAHERVDLAQKGLVRLRLLSLVDRGRQRLDLLNLLRCRVGIEAKLSLRFSQLLAL
ncbi:hypothetical protein FQZ97_1192480 [compost metagenome]